MSYFNNKVTYHKKWDTLENKEYHAKIHKMLRDKCVCSFHCPVSWAKETYELLETLHKEYGLAYQKYSRYRLPAHMLHQVCLAPLKYLVASHQGYRDEPLDPLIKFKKRVQGSWSIFVRALSDTKQMIVAAVYNRIFRPRLKISQIKEKYGSLRFSYSVNGSCEDEKIERLVRELEITLSLKGAYFPLENIYEWSTGWWDKDFSYETEQTAKETKVTHYSYRKVMREMLPKEEYAKLQEAVAESRELTDTKAQKAIEKCISSVIDVEMNKIGKSRFFNSPEEEEEHKEYCETLRRILWDS